MDVEPLKRKLLLDRLEVLKKGTSVTAFRCIVFFKTRHGVRILLDHLRALEKAASESNSDKQLNALFGGADKLKVKTFVGKGTKTISETGASQEITRQHFLKGECNLLLATSVAEEGTDTYTHTYKETRQPRIQLQISFVVLSITLTCTDQYVYKYAYRARLPGMQCCNYDGRSRQ